MRLLFWRKPKVQSTERLTDEGFRVDGFNEPVFGIQQGPGVLLKVHPPEQCAPDPCVIHNPSDHHMRDWPLNWRQDRKLMERICPHGQGHPDPDDLLFQIKAGRPWQSNHGCDGCCAVPGQVVSA